ncbi:MAG: hypothetical protein A2Y03_00475 [Omnitrophica WOR_2 bacterium GWF2_38_59]|nr:MAG: hypothetical protein A2Y03_00475 [Omnitrophica WOR_2 bacterium GWF2_38_59]OGX47743.1 MAG: hypothetical protein A2243_00365 [Omnitrophica WOR_2 bacterium RIFOXYA2_FULL_38_17]OGX50433.1 MAG: hypothetical protein A2267_09280 [Omnitrophica WOR_2 bacterium RIFOXYA12_FULL_38_10]OGX55782.1 MAG: hypothetical protein A2306_11055 [Omnitrophica WOR_2 bacterium RIFOXYB2_FULL_38_16]
MKKYKNFTIKEYLDVLSKKEPVPGGGSAAALTGALGAGLITMVANYSRAKSSSKVIEKKIQKIILESERMKNRLLELVDLDARAYIGIVEAKKGSSKEKNAAVRNAKKVSKEVCTLSYKAIQLTPFLVEKGNKYLISDIEVAIEMLFAAFNSSLALIKS